MHVLKLTLDNFRGFAHSKIVFGRGQIAVLAGVNGSGKSSILDALAALLEEIGRELLQGLKEQPAVHEFTSTDFKDGQEPLTIAIEMSPPGGGQPLTWSASATKFLERVGASSVKPGQLRDRMQELRARLGSDNKAPVPVVVLYRTNRAVIDVPVRIRTAHAFDQLSAFDGALESRTNDFRLFFEWFRDREDLENQWRASGSNDVDAQLLAVRSAIEGLLPGFKHPRVRRDAPLRMTVEKDGAEFSIEQLSDGEKCLLAMAGDLSRRLAIANPANTRPNEGVGVVLIDEIELHLHPGWQREVIGRLTSTFPNCQFIVTTHSAQVLGGVKAQDVIVLDKFEAFAPAAPTAGRDSNAILTQIMNVPARSLEFSARIKSIEQLLDDGRTTEARALLETLDHDLSSSDTEVIRLRTLLHFLEQ